jgi:hypothetical protein
MHVTGWGTPEGCETLPSPLDDVINQLVTRHSEYVNDIDPRHLGLLAMELFKTDARLFKNSVRTAKRTQLFTITKIN